MSDVALSALNLSPLDVGAPQTSAAVALTKAAERLLARVAYWSPQRWRASARRGVRAATARPDSTPARCCDVMYELVQHLADAGALAEARAPRPVPRLDSDLVLPDQLRVMVADLLAARSERADELRASCAALIDATARLL